MDGSNELRIYLEDNSGVSNGESPSKRQRYSLTVQYGKLPYSTMLKMITLNILEIYDSWFERGSVDSR